MIYFREHGLPWSLSYYVNEIYYNQSNHSDLKSSWVSIAQPQINENMFYSKQYNSINNQRKSFIVDLSL